MDIAGLWNSLRGIGPLESSGQSKTPPAAAPVPPDNSERGVVAVSPLSNAALADVLSRYDVRQISPRDFSQLLQELKQTGAISEADHQELALLRLELDAEGVDPDEVIDLVQFLEKKLQAQQRELEKQEQKTGQPVERAEALKATLRQIDWIQKFAWIHSSGGYRPLDAAA